MIRIEDAYLYAELPQYQKLVHRTMKFVEQSLERVQNPYVACSFGKDSSVLLHIVRKFRPDIPVILARRIETDLLDNYDEVIQKWGKLNLTIVTYTGWLEEGFSGLHLEDVLTINTESYDSFFVGLRAEESWARKVSLKKYGMFHKLKIGKIRIAPLAWWAIDDVICYIVTNNIPVLGKYFKEGFDSRTTANISSSFPHECIQSLKRRNLSAYNQLLKILPEAKYYG